VEPTCALCGKGARETGEADEADVFRAVVRMGHRVIGVQGRCGSSSDRSAALRRSGADLAWCQ